MGKASINPQKKLMTKVQWLKQLDQEAAECGKQEQPDPTGCFGGRKGE